MRGRWRGYLFLAFSLTLLSTILAASLWFNLERARAYRLLNSVLNRSGVEVSMPKRGAAYSPLAILRAAQPFLSRPDFKKARIGIYYVHLSALPGWHDANLDNRDLYDVVAVGTEISPYGLPKAARTYHQVHRVDLFYDPNTASLCEVRFDTGGQVWPSL